MIQVSAATLYGGTSHKNPSQRAKTTLLTKHGKEFFQKKFKLFAEAEKNGCVEFYKQHLTSEMNEINRELSKFLRDDDMIKKYKMNDEDQKGWKIWRELSDEYSVLAYFLKK